MNIQVKSVSRYCGNTTVSILTAASIYRKENKEVVIVTNNIDEYRPYFKACENYKETFLVNEQTIVGEVLQAKKLSSDLKANCICVSKGIYILPIKDENAIKDLARAMFKSLDIFVYDIKNIMINPMYLRVIFSVFEYMPQKIYELLDAYSKSQQTEKARTIFICNKFMLGYDNQDKIARSLKTKVNQIIFIKHSTLLRNPKQDEIISFVFKAFDQLSEYVNHKQQLSELTNYSK